MRNLWQRDAAGASCKHLGLLLPIEPPPKTTAGGELVPEGTQHLRGDARTVARRISASSVILNIIYIMHINMPRTWRSGISDVSVAFVACVDKGRSSFQIAIPARAAPCSRCPQRRHLVASHRVGSRLIAWLAQHHQEHTRESHCCCPGIVRSRVT